MPHSLTGYSLLANVKYTKGTAFSLEERDTYKLRGLLPPRVCDMSVQLQRALANLRRKTCDIDRYVFMQQLVNRSQTLFYRVLIDHIEELMPVVYTPTVGQACREFAHIYRQAQGFYITLADKGYVRAMLDHWPEKDIRMIVVTDGERILGLGDLGANGMGIPIGKLALYCACAGIRPEQCLPVMIDVGTDNVPLREDAFYLGTPCPRVRGEPYIELLDEFVQAVQDAYPKALIQFEDFLTPNAYLLLNRYRQSVLCFNDDIQGTAAVALAGIYSACTLANLVFTQLRIMFLGAGSAATGIADLIVFALVEQGLTLSEARARLWFVDVEGLLVSSRPVLPEHNARFAQDYPPMDFVSAIDSIQPHVLIGATGAANAFTSTVIEKMATYNVRPIIFALSNPTANAECTASQVYEWSQGRAIFASGSPFPPVVYRGQFFRPAQGNNAYIFPGVGLGAMLVEASLVSDEMFLIAARVLADSLSAEDLAEGALYPPLRKIREVSLAIACAVAETAYAQGVARLPHPGDIKTFIQQRMYDPNYAEL
ncbi:MAG: NAD-dependent malic enzyme [Pseudomonadota bacterium]|jgi:malate dehydrogenase (oxaloacetate-decarboxylating)(NADP+)